MNRQDFQDLADVRVEEAQMLLAAGFYDGAYYLAGYAVECALKACVAKLMREFDYPPKNTQRYYTHDINALVDLAGLGSDRARDSLADTDLAVKWSLVVEWTEESRYGRKTEVQARAILDAIANTSNGVLPWIKARW